MCNNAVRAVLAYRSSELPLLPPPSKGGATGARLRQDNGRARDHVGRLHRGAWRSHARAGSRRPMQTSLRCRTGITSATPRALLGAASAHVLGGGLAAEARPMTEPRAQAETPGCCKHEAASGAADTLTPAERRGHDFNLVGSLAHCWCRTKGATATAGNADDPFAMWVLPNRTSPLALQDARAGANAGRVFATKAILGARPPRRSQCARSACGADRLASEG